MSTETPLKFLVDVNGYASTNMQLFYMLKSYDYIILDFYIYFISYSLYFNIKYLVMYIKISIQEWNMKKNNANFFCLKTKWPPMKNTSNL